MPQTTKLLKVILDALHHTKMDALCAPVTRGAGVVFMLHHVRPYQNGDFAPNRILEITPQFLEVVVQHVLEQGFEPVSMDGVHARLTSGQKSDRPFAAFTFDDGYRDNRDYALPVLKKYDIPMTVYVASDFADGEGKLWWLTLEDVIRNVGQFEVLVDGQLSQIECRTLEEKISAFESVYWQLRPLPDCEIHRIVDSLALSAGINPLAAGRRLAMDWDELRQFAAEPLVTIGAHTRSHASLAKYSAVEARRQMQSSIARIEAELQTPCRHFSYPYGDAGSAGPREFSLAGAMGVRTAVTTAKGVVPAGDIDLCAIPRFSLNGDFQDLRYLKVLLSGLPFAMWNLANKISPARLSEMKNTMRPGGRAPSTRQDTCPSRGQFAVSE
jgi:peptidoglycan/xylan/chitin deacetylase (PgdA/CDA1 family)